MRYALLLISLLVTITAYADDTSSIDSIVNAYYEVVSGPEGFIYDADRDTNIHADGALITKVFPDGRFQRHDLSTEQAMISVPYDQAFFEYEVDRRIERYGNIAHVWSEFEMRTSPEAEPYSGGLNSISLYFTDNRWWISSWSTQYRDLSIEPSKAPTVGKLTDLNTEQFADVVKSIVQDTLQACEVQGGMQGRAKMNLAVVGE
ncbi:MAG: hypothetical protein VXX12_06950, partial [Pseudomonadota bacterium]|nr:hypothetical protein [Pseudomonadota bacterium]